MRSGAASVAGFKIDLNETTFFLGLETLLATRRPGLPLWRERLFVLIARNAVRPTRSSRSRLSALSSSACRWSSESLITDH
jgi:K+ transporter